MWQVWHLLAIAGAGSVAIISLTTFAGALAHLVVTGDSGPMLSLQQATAANLPAVLALGGFVVALIGLIPRWAVPAGWGALVASLVIRWFGELFEFPQALINASPFSHPPAVPAQEFEWLPVLVLLAVAVGLTSVGIAAFRRRNLTT
jgi:ABC-2 type transport system permease protein